MQCDVLLDRLALFVFDAAVNQGQAAATIMLQEHLNVHPDGIIGSGTLAAMRKSLSNRDYEFMALRALRYAIVTMYLDYAESQAIKHQIMQGKL